MQQAAQQDPNHPNGLRPGLPSRPSRGAQRPNYRQLNGSSDDEEEQGQQQARQRAAGRKRRAAAAADTDSEWGDEGDASDEDSLAGEVEFEDFDQAAWEETAAAADGLMGLADAADAADAPPQGARGESSQQQPSSKKQRQQQVADGRWVSDGVLWPQCAHIHPIQPCTHPARSLVQNMAKNWHVSHHTSSLHVHPGDLPNLPCT
jgi:hypothetical protein